MNTIHWRTASYATRREFVAKMAAGVGGLSAASFVMGGCAGTRPQKTIFTTEPRIELGDSTVSLATGSDRREIVYNSLVPLQSQLKEAIGDRQVLIKVNFMGTGRELNITHPDAVRGVLDALKPIYPRRIMVGESKGFDPGFEAFGYLPLKDEYDVELVDIYKRSWSWHWILDNNMYPTPVRVYDDYLDPNMFIISVTRMKTHNAVVATLSLKNLAMGAPMKRPDLKINDKSKMHAIGKSNSSPKMINFNLFLMAHRTRPHFSVLDGFVGMEGDGPGDGQPVEHQIALAGADFVAVDRIGAELMGIPFEDIGYLNYCATAGLGQGDRSRIKIVGADPAAHVIPYKLHSTVEHQLKWKEDMIFLDESLQVK